MQDKHCPGLVIEPEAHPPLPDTKAIFGRRDILESSDVARRLCRENFDCAQHAELLVAIEPS